jgi:protoporphyrin/coproporphyrin ferrochelatase
VKRLKKPVSLQQKTGQYIYNLLNLKTGILLVNLGTPDSPSTGDVRKYLREFLSDPRVIDISPAGRFMLVNFIIAPFRSPRSAALYAKVWDTKNGSPLLYHSIRQKELLQQNLGNEYDVQLAMRYQNPSIEKALSVFKSQLYKKIIVLPLFPQYASASTGSVQQKIMEIVSQWEVVPEIKFINSFCNNDQFISAFAERGNEHAAQKFDHVLMSFHGLPERQIKKADPVDHCLHNGCCDELKDVNAFCYRAQCFETARMLAGKLQLGQHRYTVCFQSRLGKTPWIKPYSDEVIIERAKKGDKKLLVFAPAFVSDCLETIYEIGIEYDELFKKHGGEKITMVKSLNDLPSWISAIQNMVS